MICIPTEDGGNQIKDPDTQQMKNLPNWDVSTCSRIGSMLGCLNEGDRKVQAKEILGKKSEIQRRKEANDGMVQLLCIEKMEYATQIEGGFA